MRDAVSTRFNRQVWLVLLALGLVYLVINLGIPRLQINSTIRSVILPAFLWGLIILLILRLPRYNPAGKMASRGGLIQMSLILGIGQVVFYGLGGLFTGFGKSPSSFALTGILTNLLLTGGMLTGMEFSRAWLLNHLGKRAFLSIALVSIIYTVLNLTLNQLTRIGANMSTITFMGSYVLPSLAESLLASLLALLAGPLASLAYRGMLSAFWVFCPILPNLSWSLKGMIGVFVPIAGMIITWNVYTATALHGKVKKQSSSGFPVGWILVAITAVLIIWFAVGIFPLHPVLILTGSMTPVVYPGDLAIIAKSSDKNFSVGDIIEFRKSQTANVVHRVVAINDIGGQKTYVTKGDANDDVDISPVIPENAVGKMVFHIPKVGWVANAVKSMFAR